MKATIEYLTKMYYLPLQPNPLQAHSNLAGFRAATLPYRKTLTNFGPGWPFRRMTWRRSPDWQFRNSASTTTSVTSDSGSVRPMKHSLYIQTTLFYLKILLYVLICYLVCCVNFQTNIFLPNQSIKSNTVYSNFSTLSNALRLVCKLKFTKPTWVDFELRSEGLEPALVMFPVTSFSMTSLPSSE